MYEKAKFVFWKEHCTMDNKREIDKENIGTPVGSYSYNLSEG